MSIVDENISKEVAQAIEQPKTSKHKRGRSEPDAKLLKKSEWFSPLEALRTQKARLVTTEYKPGKPHQTKANTQAKKISGHAKHASWSSARPSKPMILN